MDRVLSRLSSYSAGLAYDEIAPGTVHQAKRVWIDTLGCALAANDSPAVTIARIMADECGTSAVSMIGGGHSSSTWATFVNGVMIRCLDFNDFYQGPRSKTGGHPSDTLAPSLATAASAHRDGRALLVTAVLGWEVYAASGDAIQTKVLDQGLYAAIASACVAANNLGLSEQETAHAIAIAAVGNLSVRQTRFGHVSMWKSCAVPYACKSGVEAAILAQGGMTGPGEVFEGDFGVFKLSSGSFDLLPPLGGATVPFKIHQSTFKQFPIGSLAQTAIECAINLRKQLSGVADIERVTISTSATARAVMASPEKWQPTTRETADHSMPFGVALGLLHGAVDVEHFTPDNLAAPEVMALLAKIRVVPSDDATALFPEQRKSTVEVLTNSGRRLILAKGYPKGHPRDPMSDEEVELKFRGLVEPRIGRARATRLLEALWNLEDVTDVSDLISMTQVPRGE